MEELKINETSLKNKFSYCQFNCSFNESQPNYNNYLKFVDWMNWISIGIGLPLTLIVIIAVFSQVKRDQGAPVYIINLLFADLIQLCSRIPMNLLSDDILIVLIVIWYFSLLASVGFMVCISFERYLVIAMPLWYRFRRNIKTSVVVCVMVWILSLLLLLFVFMSPVMGIYILPAFLLLPFPLFIFFLVGTFKTLSGALSVPADEKRRIIAIQVVVLLIYALLYLPIIALLFSFDLINKGLHVVAPVCMFLSPLADTTLYLFIRKSVLDKFLVSLCSCKLCNNQEIVPNIKTV
ncbi:mas-related G-protein coupled receptor member X4-like [Girardinichthys multiradiatus]|uniref:mas-related G-protein coupled receptor member X4-like n=1 Tax=Girardinichthys multiradiatus TaxID=208333 RepID=UPI001FAC7971|nr:mas-related G-protein coupled receptor member X4-like [Girardinichthys multiradiatus]